MDIGLFIGDLIWIVPIINICYAKISYKINKLYRANNEFIRIYTKEALKFCLNLDKSINICQYRIPEKR